MFRTVFKNTIFFQRQYSEENNLHYNRLVLLEILRAEAGTLYTGLGAAPSLG
jgi:hypothetical protein